MTVQTSQRPACERRERTASSYQHGGHSMSWAKLDDGLDEHPKVETMLEDDELTALAAVGLWVLTMTNSSRRGTNGAVTSRTLRKIAPEHGERLADALADVGLYDRDGAVWLIHDFLDYNPTAEARSTTAKALSDAGKKGAEARWNKANPIADPNGLGHSEPQSLGDGPSQCDRNAPVPSPPVEGKKDARASALHPDLTAVLAIYAALPADKAVELDEYQLNSACLAQPDTDQLAAANVAVGWQTSPDMATWKTASSLQRSALNSAAKRSAHLDGIREAATKAGIAPPALNARDQAKADKAARSAKDLEAVARLMGQGEAA